MNDYDKMFVILCDSCKNHGVSYNCDECKSQFCSICWHTHKEIHLNKNLCRHKITWNYDVFEIDDDADCVRFDGICEKCKRNFMKTFVDASYSVMDGLTNEWINYPTEAIGESIN